MWSNARMRRPDATMDMRLNHLEAHVTEARDDEHHEDPDNAASGHEDEPINDPLTRTDVEARRVPFGSQHSTS